MESEQTSYFREGITIIKGDCLQLIWELEEKPSCLVTDPPYMLTSGGTPPPRPDSMGGKFSTKSEFRGELQNQRYDNSGALFEITDWEDWIPVITANMAADCDAYVMSNNRELYKCLDALEVSDWKHHNILVWKKNNAVPNRWYAKNLEFIAYYYRGKAETINDPSSTQFLEYPIVRGSEHPTEKPVELMEKLILNSTEPGELVLDPFVGSGSTAVACVRTGRRFVGFEIDEQWYIHSSERVDKEIDDMASRNEVFE